MGLVLVRIDDRLIHGQVIEGWCKVLNINHIIVCNDTVAKDEIQKALLCLAVPSHIKVSVLTIEQTKELLLKGNFKEEQVLMLLSSPSDVLSLIKKNVKINEVNIGGLHYSSGKVQVQKAVSLNEQDLHALEELDRLGVHIESRVLPTDQKIDIN